MSDGFNQPKIAINRVYTRLGDGGQTALVGGQKVAKDDLRIAAYGTVDELNAFVGAARQSLLETDDDGCHALAETLRRVQHALFNLGSILATLPEDQHPAQPRVTEADVTGLEVEMDRCNDDLSPLRSFVLPGGHRANCDLHVCRTVCRRAERELVSLARATEVDEVSIAYLNRLSDAFFVWSRWSSFRLQVPETLWEPNAATPDT
ncbi:MAG: cob(I)yrinic acid a,c-diamide adenosyltransferase [Myxococcales bacterium]|nr:cob(I)yrinic acid a,c-diamide adenosyltransferase [Myxococcales bacterium]